jgi:hypothetical protein
LIRAELRVVGSVIVNRQLRTELFTAKMTPPLVFACTAKEAGQVFPDIKTVAPKEFVVISTLPLSALSKETLGTFPCICADPWPVASPFHCHMPVSGGGGVGVAVGIGVGVIVGMIVGGAVGMGFGVVVGKGDAVTLYVGVAVANGMPLAPGEGKLHVPETLDGYVATVQTVPAGTSGI